MGVQQSNESIETEWQSSPVVALRIVVFSSIILVTVASNSFILVASATDRRMRTTTNAFFASMAVADMVMGTSNFLFAGIHGIHRKPSEMGPIACVLWCILESGCGTVSLYHLLAVAIHRLRCILSPFHKQRKTRSHLWTTVTLVAIWSLPIALWTSHYALKNLGIQVCAPIEEKHFVVLTLLVLYVVPLLGIIGTNIGIVLALKRTKTLVKGVANKVTAVQEEQSAGRHGKQRRATIILAVCSGVFLVCWIPHVILWTLSNIFQWKAPLTLRHVILYLYYSHPTVQPLLLIAMNNTFSQKLRQVLGRNRSIQPIHPVQQKQQVQSPL